MRVMVFASISTPIYYMALCFERSIKFSIFVVVIQKFSILFCSNLHLFYSILPYLYAYKALDLFA